MRQEIEISVFQACHDSEPCFQPVECTLTCLTAYISIMSSAVLRAGGWLEILKLIWLPDLLTE